MLDLAWTGYFGTAQPGAPGQAGVEAAGVPAEALASRATVSS